MVGPAPAYLISFVLECLVACWIGCQGSWHSLHTSVLCADSPFVLCMACRQPNDMFAEFVKAGQPLGRLADEDLCVLAALGCGNSPGL